jgi:hypothetical protein
VSDGAVLTVVAVVLAIVVALLFRLLRVLDSAELSLRRLAADARATRKAVVEAGELASAVDRDAGLTQVALLHLQAGSGPSGGRASRPARQRPRQAGPPRS